MTLDSDGHPLAFVAATPPVGAVGSEATLSRLEFRSEVRGLAGFQKEGVVAEVTSGRAWRLCADEGRYLGGTDLAPAPLMHWAAGLHADVTTRIGGSLGRLKRAPDRVRVTLLQGFGSSGSFVRGTAKALVGELSWTVEVDEVAPRDHLDAAVSVGMSESPALAAVTGRHEGAFALYINGVRTAVPGVPPLGPAVEVDPFRAHARSPEPVAGRNEDQDILSRSSRVREPGIELPHDAHDTRYPWPIRAVGEYRAGAGTVTTAVDFPLADASCWTLTSDVEGLVAPSPLAYLSAGAAFCYHTQLARYAKVRKLPLSSPRLVQRSAFAIEATGGQAAPFQTHLFVNGRVDAEQAKSLLVAAVNTCYVHRSLSLPIKTQYRANAREPQ